MKSESSREQKYQGAKVPCKTSSMYGTFAPGSEKYVGTKVLVTDDTISTFASISTSESRAVSQRKHSTPCGFKAILVNC